MKLCPFKGTLSDCIVCYDQRNIHLFTCFIYFIYDINFLKAREDLKYGVMINIHIDIYY